MVATATWTAWACVVRVAVTEPAALDEARELLSRHMDAVELACSRFRDDSELAVVDASPGRWTPISPILTELLAVALDAARTTGGDVDPTIGASLIGLGYDRHLADLSDGPVWPTPAPGWRNVELDQEGRRVRVSPGVHLDLGATAPAWTADQAAATITRRTGSGCIVSIGGDVAVAGSAPPDGWRVRVEDGSYRLDDQAVGSSAVVCLRRGGLATSSIRSRSWRRGGRSLHHLVEPRSGLPPPPVWRTVSAVAGSCLRANTLTTAAVVRGHGAWPGLRSDDAPVRLVTVDGDVHVIGAWPQAPAWPT